MVSIVLEKLSKRDTPSDIGYNFSNYKDVEFVWDIVWFAGVDEPDHTFYMNSNSDFNMTGTRITNNS